MDLCVREGVGVVGSLIMHVILAWCELGAPPRGLAARLPRTLQQLTHAVVSPSQGVATLASECISALLISSSGCGKAAAERAPGGAVAAAAASPPPPAAAPAPHDPLQLQQLQAEATRAESEAVAQAQERADLLQLLLREIQGDEAVAAGGSARSPLFLATQSAHFGQEVQHACASLLCAAAASLLPSVLGQGSGGGQSLGCLLSGSAPAPPLVSLHLHLTYFESLAGCLLHLLVNPSVDLAGIALEFWQVGCRVWGCRGVGFHGWVRGR